MRILSESVKAMLPRDVRSAYQSELYAEKPLRILKHRCRELLRLLAARRCHCVECIGHISRDIYLAAVRYGRQIWAVRFYKQPVAWNGTAGGAHVFGVLVCHGPAEGDVPAETNVFKSGLGTAGKTVHNANDPGMIFYGFKRPAVRLAVVNLSLIPI